MLEFSVLKSKPEKYTAFIYLFSPHGETEETITCYVKAVMCREISGLIYN